MTAQCQVGSEQPNRAVSGAHNDRCASLLGQGCDCRDPFTAAVAACICVPCTTPGYGAPGFDHCAACCYGSLIAEYDHDCPVIDHRAMAERQWGARCEHSVTQVGDREWRCWKCGADQTVMEAEEPDEEHGPWSYTEYGVLCSCGLGMRNERCREDLTDLLPEVRQELESARAACKSARWPEQHRDDCAWCAYVARWSQ